MLSFLLLLETLQRWTKVNASIIAMRKPENIEWREKSKWNCGQKQTEKRIHVLEKKKNKKRKKDSKVCRRDGDSLSDFHSLSLGKWRNEFKSLAAVVVLTSKLWRWFYFLFIYCLHSSLALVHSDFFFFILDFIHSIILWSLPLPYNDYSREKFQKENNNCGDDFEFDKEKKNSLKNFSFLNAGLAKQNADQWNRAMNREIKQKNKIEIRIEAKYELKDCESEKFVVFISLYLCVHCTAI